MQKSRMTVFGLCLSLGLTQIALPAVTLARGVGDIPTAKRARIVKPVSDTRAFDAPIGRLESARAVMINGRLTAGEQDIWNGELIQAIEAPASMKLAAIGQMELASGALVRVTAVGNANQPTLVAAIEAGSAELSLVPAASAYLEAAGQAWVVSGDTSVRLTVNNGTPSVHTARGKVVSLGSWSLNLPSLSALRVAPATAETKAEMKAASERDALLRSIRQIAPRLEPGENSGVRLMANARATMLGTIESTGTLKLNGREIRRQELLWDGELIQAPANAEARAVLANIGQVRLAKSASAKLSMARAAGPTNRPVLAAHLMQGELTVRLASSVGAYVETQGKAFAAEPGAHFRVSEQAGEVTLEIKAGAVREISPWTMDVTPALAAKDGDTIGGASDRQYNVRPADSGSYMRNVKPSTSQDLRFIVTDRAGKAMPGLPVVFTLNSSDGQFVGVFGVDSLASRSFTARSDDKGIVVVPFTAGRATGSASISAVVAGTSEAGGSVVVVSDNDKGFWSKRTAWPVFGVIAGAVVAGVVVGLTREEKLPIQGSGSTQVIP